MCVTVSCGEEPDLRDEKMPRSEDAKLPGAPLICDLPTRAEAEPEAGEIKTAQPCGAPRASRAGLLRLLCLQAAAERGCVERLQETPTAKRATTARATDSYTMALYVFPPEQIPDTALAAFPAPYAVRPLSRLDFDNGYLQVLAQLTTVGHIEKDTFLGLPLPLLLSLLTFVRRSLRVLAQSQ
ncbi:hypothetical protein HK096_006257 [Nowakowskiella sp. JEL0078]|nr:hypothetical protein HK096_006257 [Nowakowskiella sp. JEL0078]